MDKIQVLDKHFKMYIPESEIQEIVRRLAAEISHDFKGKRPLLCPILTGSFMFAADLIRELDLDSKVAFVNVRKAKPIPPAAPAPGALASAWEYFSLDIRA